ncbi:MAG: glutamine-hydrolyzing carbamoyl-phosphate synthase small subunit [Candidatus Omnitrophica bacterium]|nr:glutamine-hydrolyzing carbamoyl-phosphate synthase small subunit [Candidatus Omnitrophota bacterium]
MKAILMLEDQKTFEGKCLAGITGERIGEVMFNTTIVGYQEILTTAANAEKIIVFTYPLIGNYGVNDKFNESEKVWAQAAVLKEPSRIYSNWQATGSFEDFVKKHNLLVLTGVDTRALTVHLRQKGQMLGIISTTRFNTKELLAVLEDFRKRQPVSKIAQISIANPKTVGKLSKNKKRIALIDIGLTRSLLAQLEECDLAISILPYSANSQQIVKTKPQGLIISDGPEQDLGLRLVEQNIKPLIGKLPIFGIGTGMQVVASCLGAKVFKMHCGHHGVNYPIHRPGSYKGQITMQNHSWVVDADSLARRKDIKVTAYNLNDHTVEEIESKKLKILGIQYVPARPGFNEINPAILRFVKMMERRK